MADFDAQLPVRTIASEFTTEVANAAGTTINPAEDYGQGSTTSGENGVLIQGATTTAAPTYTTATTNPLSLDTSGNLRVTGTFTPSGLQNVNVTQWDTTALGVPTAYGTAPVTGNYIGVNAFVTNTVAISAASLPLPTGASTSALQTTGNTSLASIVTNTNSLILAQGSTTSGQTGNLAMGAVTTAAPTYTTGQTDPLSLDTAGNLRVTLASGTVTVAGNLTNNNAAPAANNIGVLPAVAAASAPTWTTGDQVLLSEDLSGNLRVITGTGSTTAVTGNVTVVQPTAASLQTTTTPVTAQGSTTAGQTGNLGLAAVTTAAPTYTTATTNPLSMDTSGNLRVTGTFGTAPSTLTYFTDAAVASGATVTHSVAGPVSLSHIHSSGSGELKMNVATGITGSETDKWVGFTSAANQNCEFNLSDVVVIPTGSSVKVTLKNRDTVAQDLYLTFETH